MTTEVLPLLSLLISSAINFREHVAHDSLSGKVIPLNTALAVIPSLSVKYVKERATQDSYFNYSADIDESSSESMSASLGSTSSGSFNSMPSLFSP